MKRFFTILLLVILSLGISHAQVTNKSILPTSLTSKNVLGSNDLCIPYANKEEVARVKTEYAKGKGISGKLMDADINVLSAAHKIEIGKSMEVYRLQIQLSDAAYVSLYFDDFHITPGDYLHIYTPDYSTIHGAYLPEHNPSNGLFATPRLSGDVIIIEYTHNGKSAETPRLHINKLGYGIIDKNKEFQILKMGGGCTHPVACETNPLWIEKAKGAVEIDAVFQYDLMDLSGSFINNALEDCRPLVVTDWPGILNQVDDFSQVMEGNFLLWVFNLYQERATCGGTALSSSAVSFNGCVRLADTPGDEFDGANFILLQLIQKIPSSVEVYFNGWTRSTTPASSGTYIHHSFGYKEIGYYYSPAIPVANWLAVPKFWQISPYTNPLTNSWLSHNSNGAPLFNQDGLIVGCYLEGDTYDCNPSDVSIFGMFSEAWNPSSDPNTSLNVYLDPNNTGIMSLNGRYNTCDITSCTDGIQNGTEDGIDCGGFCGPCAHCTDGILNFDEVMIDCGGMNCLECNACENKFTIYHESFANCDMSSAKMNYTHSNPLASTSFSSSCQDKFLGIYDTPFACNCVEDVDITFRFLLENENFDGCIGLISDDDLGINMAPENQGLTGIGCMTTFPINISLYENITLSFDYALFSYSSTFSVSIENVEAGTSTELYNISDYGYSSSNLSFDLDGYITGDSIRIRFCYDDLGSWAYGVALDNISVCGVDKRRVYAKIGLEGVYNPTTAMMSNALAANNLIPPYPDFFMDAPFYYTPEQWFTSAANIPADMVDWVLVELRSTESPYTLIDRSNAYVDTQGNLRGTDQQLGVLFPYSPSGAYKLAIYHRGHMAIISTGTVNLPSDGGQIDFTESAETAMGEAQLKSINSKYCMHAGDYDTNGVINSLDYNIWASNSAAVLEYLSHDGDCNGVVNAIDYNLWYDNRSKVGSPYIQF